MLTKSTQEPAPILKAQIPPGQSGAKRKGPEPWVFSRSASESAMVINIVDRGWRLSEAPEAFWQKSMPARRDGFSIRCRFRVPIPFFALFLQGVAVVGGNACLY